MLNLCYFFLYAHPDFLFIRKNAQSMKSLWGRGLTTAMDIRQTVVKSPRVSGGGFVEHDLDVGFPNLVENNAEVPMDDHEI